MTMMNTAAGTASAPYWGQSRGRISWGAVVAGAVVAVATTILLSLLGAAMGAGSIHALDATANDLSNYGIGAAIWSIINLALSMAFGGYVTARLSGTHSHLDGELHGVTMWAIAVLLGAILLAQALSGLAGLMTPGIGPVVSRVFGGSGAVSSAAPSELNPQTTIDRLQQALTSSGDPTTMSREQIGAEVATLVRSSLHNGSVSEPDRTRLVNLVAAQSGVTRDEAARRVSRMEDEVRAGVAQVEQRARTAADEVARSTATAARALFTALVVGLLSALVGAWLGTRHKRVLHPVVERAYHPTAEHVSAMPAVHEPAYAYGMQPLHERAEPASVSVYDDTGRLVVQTLRGVTFPMDKQDLLRLARSRNAGTNLVQSIERMADGSYANTDEVLRALGATVH